MERLAIRIISSSNDFASLLLVGRCKTFWKKHGTGITNALQSAAGLKFKHGARVQVAYADDPDKIYSFHGSAGHPGKKAISITFARKNIPGTTTEHQLAYLLMHELGHRLLEQNGRTNKFDGDMSNESDLNEWHYREHLLLFAFLPQAIRAAFPLEFANRVLLYPETGYEGNTYPLARAWRECAGHRITSAATCSSHR